MLRHLLAVLAILSVPGLTVFGFLVVVTSPMQAITTVLSLVSAVTITLPSIGV